MYALRGSITVQTFRATVIAVIAAALPLSSAVASEAAPTPNKPETNSAPTDVVILSPEQYAKAYQTKFGKMAPESVTGLSAEEAKRAASGQSLTGGVTPGSTRGIVPSVKTFLDPPGGGDAAWYIIEWKYTDRRGTFVPIRLGNSELGYNHYAQPHNIYTQAPFRVITNTTKPHVDQGAHLEYLAIVAKLDDLEVKERINIVAQAASRSENGKWITPDGGNIGVVTAYCMGPTGSTIKTLCPDWVNKLK